LKAQIARVEAQLNEISREATSITQDQQRLRENIKTLTSTAEAKQLIARYVAKANEQETALEQIEKDRRKLSEERMRLQSDLAAVIRGLSLDRKVD
jgi:chromosome segregation ATPase